jgi:inorganic triphosphatase YgiF
MKTYLMTVLTAVAFLTFACGNNNADDETSEMEQKAQELKEEMDENTKELMDAYNDQMEAIDNRIEMIKDKAADVPKELEQGYSDAMDAVDRQKDELAMKIEELKNSPTSQKIQMQIDSITNEINNTLASWKNQLSSDDK